MTFTRPDTAYWDRKFIAYMHDPLDKIFKIQGHGQRAAEFLEKYGLQKTNEEFWKKADGIAAGFERGQVPSYSLDPNKNGAIIFLDNPIITHPTSETARLKITMTGTNENSARDIHEKLIDFIEKEIGIKAGLGGYSDKFKGDEDRFAVARFLYTHLILRFKLAEQNVSGLGGFWHRVPADTRFPDHSIWQHNALCSAFCSCIELGGDESEIGMMVFSITPVQAFISKARKLRDYWTGSVLLSWLAFEGMRWVIENLGPDHILYPSLIDQPLVNEYLKQNWKVSQDGFLNPPKDIATFPNKFLFLIPMNQAESIANTLKSHIRSAWAKLYQKICNTATSKMGDFLSDDQKTYVKEIFERQNSKFWDLEWASAYFVNGSDRSEIEKLLPQSTYENPFKLLEGFNKIIADNPYFDKSGRGALYPVSHSLAQTALAVSKNMKIVTRMPETGEKCHLCGEFEVLHHRKFIKGMSAGEYKKGTGEFWHHLRKEWDGNEKNNLGYNLNENEKLCSICLTKRMTFEAMKRDSDHLLHSVFKDKKSFPSTTDIALTSFFERENLPDEKRKAFAQKVHDKSDEKADNHDRYFAILMMDGDKMGDLVNGKTLGSTWESVMHPEIVERMKKPSFEKKYRENWQYIFNTKRLVTPAIHAAISESLGDFSLYGVSSIIQKYQGTLIYAGGDDVCAVLPVEEALQAANEIRRYYTSTYKWIQKNQSPEDVMDSWTPEPGKLSINLGNGEGISISAGILICHHKESLPQMIDAAHLLLDKKAKNEAGRNACAIELRKRSGGSRYFVRQWCDEQAWESFSSIGDAVKNKSQVSTSVVYRLEQLRDGINAILKHDNWRTMLEAMILKQLDRSSVGKKDQQEIFARKMTDISVYKNSNEKFEFKPESLIVAAFMAKGGNNE
ncbi:MAG: type III-B CRISPR-associated protein Cas10/Cmr2 [Desulfobacterium sp.]|nr:type III-B CRISPR-associated protein Cas10/Cmr2 [Desulfobacterium sp.]